VKYELRAPAKLSLKQILVIFIVVSLRVDLRWSKIFISVINGSTSTFTQISAQAVTCIAICAVRRNGASAMAAMIGAASFPTRSRSIVTDHLKGAKINELEPYAYLRYVFTEWPKAGTFEAIEALLPGNLNKDQIKVG